MTPKSGPEFNADKEIARLTIGRNEPTSETFREYSDEQMKAIHERLKKMEDVASFTLTDLKGEIEDELAVRELERTRPVEVVKNRLVRKRKTTKEKTRNLPSFLGEIPTTEDVQKAIQGDRQSAKKIVEYIGDIEMEYDHLGEEGGTLERDDTIKGICEGIDITENQYRGMKASLELFDAIKTMEKFQSEDLEASSEEEMNDTTMRKIFENLAALSFFDDPSNPTAIKLTGLSEIEMQNLAHTAINYVCPDSSEASMETTATIAAIRSYLGLEQ